MSKASAISTVCAAFALGASVAFGGQVSPTDEGGTSWQAESDGVAIEWGGDGALQRIRSRGSHDVHFDDPAGIRKAQVIAEEKAKAALVRFMNEDREAERLVTIIDSDLKKASRGVREDGTTASTKQVEKTMVESLRQMFRSWTSGTLQGVVVLEKGYDRGLEEAWVTVGVSPKTVDAARALGAGLSAASAATAPPRTGSGNPGSGVEVRRTRMTGW